MTLRGWITMVGSLTLVWGAAPALYGFAPRTYAGTRVAHLAPDGRSERRRRRPAGHLCARERPISRAEVIVTARVVGGLPMLDGGEDEKIVAILRDDPIYGAVREVEDVPRAILGRLIHYFSTYKIRPEPHVRVAVGEPYGRAHAEAVIRASIEDYREAFDRGRDV